MIVISDEVYDAQKCVSESVCVCARFVCKNITFNWRKSSSQHTRTHFKYRKIFAVLFYRLQSYDHRFTANIDYLIDFVINFELTFIWCCFEGT